MGDTQELESAGSGGENLGVRRRDGQSAASYRFIGWGARKYVSPPISWNMWERLRSFTEAISL
jgi:hypothetical protein